MRRALTQLNSDQYHFHPHRLFGACTSTSPTSALLPRTISHLGRRLQRVDRSIFRQPANTTRAPVHRTQLRMPAGTYQIRHDVPMGEPANYLIKVFFRKTSTYIRVRPFSLFAICFGWNTTILDSTTAAAFYKWALTFIPECEHYGTLWNSENLIAS